MGIRRFLIVVATLLVAELSSRASEENLTNASFEEFEPSGKSVAWMMPGEIWSISQEFSCSGRFSLLFDNSESRKYVFPHQKVLLEPGKSYEFGCRIRMSDMAKTLKAIPDICLMWYDEKQKYIGGSYAFGSSLDMTEEWMPIKAVVRNLPQAFSYQIACYVSHNAKSGSKIWFDDVYIKEYDPRVLDGITTDQYRHTCDRGKVTVTVGADQSLAGMKKEYFSQLKLKILDRNNKIHQYSELDEIQPDRLVFRFDSDKLPPGEYQLACSWDNPISSKTEMVSIPFHKKETMPSRYSYIDANQRMIVDGKPFFPLGMYFPNKTVDKDQLAIFSDSPFNCMMPYAQFDQDYLDRLQASKIKIFYNLKDFYVGLSGGGKTVTTAEEGQARAIAKLQALKEHPAIIGWYINDELHHSRAEEAIKLHHLIAEADPGRPTWSILQGTRNLRVFLPSFDIMGTDPYPIPNRPPALALQWARETKQAGLDSRMLLQVIQIFNWGRYWLGGGAPKEKVLQGRSPSIKEIKAMSWMSIAGGANGLMFYSWMDLIALDKLESEILPRESFEKRWNDVKAVATEIKEMEIVLLSTEAALEIELRAKPSIATRVYGFGGKTWILAVNSDHQTTERLQISAAENIHMVETKLSQLLPQVADNKLDLQMPPLEAIFIAIQ